MQRAPVPCVVALCLAIVAIATGCDAGNGILHHRRDPGALLVAHAADVSGLDIARTVDSESLEVGEIMFEGLVRWRAGTTELLVGPDGAPLYPGTCRHLSAADRAARIAACCGARFVCDRAGELVRVLAQPIGSSGCAVLGAGGEGDGCAQLEVSCARYERVGDASPHAGLC